MIFNANLQIIMVLLKGPVIVRPSVKVVLLFGAGASAFCGPVRYRGDLSESPPLGSGPKGLFAVLQQEGGIATQFHSEVQSALISDFEEGMRLIEGMPGTWHCEFQRQISLHLAGYRVRPNNHYLRLLSPSFMRSKEIQYSTINYDMLLDDAFNQYNLIVEGSPMDSPSPQFVTLLKLHGACNILIDIKNDVHGYEVIGSPFGLQSPVGGNVGRLYLARSLREIERWCRDYKNEQFAPVIAQYVREKSFLTHATALEGIQAFWAKKIADAAVVILVGVRYVPGDNHIWKPLLESSSELFVVDPNFDAIEDWGMNRTKKPRHIAKLFSDLPKIWEAVRLGLAAA